MNFRLAIDTNTIPRTHRPVHFLRMLCDSLIPVFFKSDSLRLAQYVRSSDTAFDLYCNTGPAIYWRQSAQHVDMAFARIRKPAALDDHMKLVL